MLQSNVPQIFFGWVNLVKALRFGKSIYENDLSPFFDHAVAGKAGKDKDGLVRVDFYEFLKLQCLCIKFFKCIIDTSHDLIRSELETRQNL